MKYYLIEIATGDSKIAGKAVYEYETMKAAVANFHSKMGNAMKSNLFETELLTIINSDGMYQKTEKYTNDAYKSIEE